MEHWHLDRKLNITHLISTVMIIASLFLWGGGIERRIDGNAKDIAHLKEVQERDRQQDKEAREEFKSQLKSIETKLDRLIERL
ncbi:hypothetical protein NX722_28450 [Endozoicomonas gorgoniicola]|uniref:Uncharacterized protein n=1 Tax=Endozoicomonas gorgoniicola TaxID=1234144 RepID=A0ABT3N587_9GAMM|nr:hypothetical protein [Endozoicomonas gorgoniicola]MCW7556498.1 hypothetical protein [Endozoicomonas gorgoniicola]